MGAPGLCGPFRTNDVAHGRTTPNRGAVRFRPTPNRGLRPLRRIDGVFRPGPRSQKSQDIVGPWLNSSNVLQRKRNRRHVNHESIVRVAIGQFLWIRPVNANMGDVS